MFVGGSETTVVGLEWTMSQLMINPIAMTKAQEVKRVVGKKPKIERKDIEKMEYMLCV